MSDVLSDGDDRLFDLLGYLEVFLQLSRLITAGETADFDPVPGLAANFRAGDIGIVTFALELARQGLRFFVCDERSNLHDPNLSGWSERLGRGVGYLRTFRAIGFNRIQQSSHSIHSG